MVRKTKEEAEKTRIALLDAAEKLFYDFGVVRTSLQQIASEAGVTRGAVYWHFKDKTEILWAIADDAFSPHEDMLDRLAAQESDDPLALLYQNCIESLNAVVNNPRRRRVFTILTQRCEYVQELASLHRRNSAMRERLRMRLVHLFEKAVEKKMLSPAWSAESAATMLQTVAIGNIVVEMEYEKPSRKRDKMRNDSITSFFKALRASA